MSIRYQIEDPEETRLDGGLFPLDSGLRDALCGTAKPEKIVTD